MEERITIEVIESKEFHTENGGYSSKEVDSFLDQICDEMEAMLEEIDSLQKKLALAEARARTAPAPAQPAPQPVQSTQNVVEILEMAQRVKSETIAAAEQKAEEIIANAREEARAKLGTLEDERTALTAEVEALKKSAADFRDNLATLLKAHQDVLDKTAGLF